MILDDIFDKVNTDIPNIKDIEQEVTTEVEPLLTTLQEELSPELYTKVERTVWEIAFISEKAGFKLGAKYIVKLLAECMSDD